MESFDMDSDLWVDSDDEEQRSVFDKIHSNDASESESDIGVDRRDVALSHIEDLALSFLTQLSDSLPHPKPMEHNEEVGLSRTTTNQTHSKRKKIEFRLADRRKVRPDGSFGIRSLCYPKNSRGASAKPLAQLFRVLDLTHEALVDGLPATKRDMYYKDVSLFKSQAVVDRLVDDLAATFNLERSDLNVRATSKGLVCGALLEIHLCGGGVQHVSDSEGTLILAGEAISHFEVNGDVSWVLIVEKDAIFQSLCWLKLTNHPSMPGRGIIITGKGYPDMATRQFVKTLSDNLPSTVPILALVDGDPYGIDIISVYKFGSAALKHENDKLAAGRIEWAGVWASELVNLNIDKGTLIPITRNDEKKALAMLRRPPAIMPLGWKKELMHMLHTRRKAEIEIVSSAKLSSLWPTSLSTQNQRDSKLALTPGGTSSSHLPVSTPTSMLLRYLCDKLAGFVASYA